MIYVDIKTLTSCAYHRLHLPFKYIKGLSVTNDINKASVIVFNRLPSFDILNYKAKGVKLIMDIDDYWHLYQEHYLFQNWRPEPYENCLKIVDFVICTTDLLASKIMPFNKNVEVVPNALPFGYDQFKTSKPLYRGRFAYVGGNSHKLDISIIPGLTIPKQQPIHSYMSLYRNLNMTFAPIIDNTFNRCKSNLKALESGTVGAALMASNTPPYFNEKDKDCVIYCSDSEWKDKINYCKANHNYVADMGAKLSEHVKANYNLFEVNKIRKQLIESI